MGKLLKKVGYAGSKEKEHSWRTGVQRGYCKTGNPWARMSVQRRVRDGGDRRAARRRQKEGGSKHRGVLRWARFTSEPVCPQGCARCTHGERMAVEEGAQMTQEESLHSSQDAERPFEDFVFKVNS